jgi:hypothetical protein
MTVEDILIVELLLVQEQHHIAVAFVSKRGDKTKNTVDADVCSSTV